MPAATGSPGSPASGALSVHDSPYARILFDGHGFALYAFTKDTPRRSNCVGSCASRWPPYVIAGRPHAGAGVGNSLIGTVARGGGILQATYAGRPLYRYVGDRRPFQVLYQD